MTGFSWEAVGMAIASVLIGVGGWLSGRGRRNAEDAGYRRDTTAAETESRVVDLMRGELARLSDRVAAMEAREGKLIRHVWLLEGLMRAADLDPPPFSVGPDMPEARR